MNNAVKMLLSVVVVLLGIWTMVDPAWLGQDSWVFGLNWWPQTLNIIKGCVGPVLAFTGIVLVWITYEESRA